MKSIIGKIVDADLTVMNRFEKIVYTASSCSWVGHGRSVLRDVHVRSLYRKQAASPPTTAKTTPPDGSSLRHRYAFVRRFLLTKICPTRFYGVGRMNRHRTINGVLVQPPVPSRPVSADTCLW